MALAGCEQLKHWLPSTAKTTEGMEAPTEVPAETAGPRLECRDSGKLEASLSMNLLGRKTPAEQVVVLEPLEQARVPFEGVRLDQLLDNVYGRRWRQKPSIRFSMGGGGSALVTTSDVGRYRAWLVWRRMDRPEFAAERRGTSEVVQLGPLYLVWDSLADSQLQKRGTWGWLPRVTAMDLTTVVGDMASLKPAADASEEVVAGYALFTQTCIGCHAIGGHGSLVGPELNQPVSITELMRDEWLAKYIDDPRKVRDRSAMPPLPPETPQRPKAIASVIAYLKYVAAHPPAPLPAAETPTDTGLHGVLDGREP